MLFDTNVLIAGLVQPHQFHDRSWPWMQRVHHGEIEMLVSAHSLAELYSNLTKLPGTPRLSPQAVGDMIAKSVEAHATLVALDASDYSGAIRRMAKLGLAGGVIYDGLIAWAAEKAGVDHLLTLNPRDFRRVWPEGIDRILTP